MATNERNQDINQGKNSDKERNNPKGATQNAGLGKDKPQNEESHEQNRTTHPSAQQGYDANHDSGKDYKQPDQNREKQDPTGRNRQL